MSSHTPLPTQRQRFLALLRGETPVQPVFITRLETWHKSHLRSGGLPGRFAGMTLNELHHATGIGRLKFVVPYALKLRGVEVEARLNGEVCYQAYEPEIENFPGMWDYISNEKPGETISELRTPVGTLRLRHAMLAEGAANGTEPYLHDHLICNDDDLKTAAYILERAEFVPRFAETAALQAELGEDAVVVPLLHRVPFQQVLLEYYGEINLFYRLNDHPAQVEYLLELLDAQMVDILQRLEDFEWPYVEFPDNLHAMMTNPRLFRRYNLPELQKYTAILHGQEKKAGSHTDGNVRPLLALLAESGLDVCESFSPYPLTDCTFEQAWLAWGGVQPSSEKTPLIWGGIPSPILEATTSEADFRAYIDRLLALAGGRRIIWGIADLFMRHNSIDRAVYIADQLSKC